MVSVRLQCRLFFVLPAEVFSSCLAIVSAFMVGGLFLWPALQSVNQSINKFISRRSTEARATVRLCRIKEKCLKTDLKCVNGCVTGYQTVWEIWPSAETPSSVHWRRLYFQLTRVHSALELFGRCALQIYLLTCLLFPEQITRLIDCNFIICLLYDEDYWHLPHITYCILSLCCTFLYCLISNCVLSVGQIIGLLLWKWRGTAMYKF